MGRSAQGPDRRAASGVEVGLRGGHRGLRGSRDRAGAATDAGLADPRVTSDAKHVEIGLTDKSDSAGWIMRELWRSGIAPGQVLIAGDELDPWRPPGSDANLSGACGRALGRAEPEDVPRRRGSAAAQTRTSGPARAADGELPIVDPDPAWTLVIDGVDPLLERFHESLFTLSDGLLGTRGSVIAEHPSGDPAVLMSGVYTRTGAERTCCPRRAGTQSPSTTPRRVRSVACSICTPACSSNSSNRRPDRSARCCSPR